ncbi:MAG: hypothetical protein JWP96_2097 [Polaromonas sp.]|nr:hypothetical protein [Polaromonas sp.]
MRWIFTLLVVGLLAACASPQYTVDDGRKVNEELLGHLRSFGAGEQVMRQAIARSAALKDSGCDTQWELPFSVATSYNWSQDDRVAWVRELGVDERITVVGAAPESALKLRDKIQDIASYSQENSEKMLLALAERRDAGSPFSIKLSTGKSMQVTPFKVCRGYTRLAPPNTPRAQNYHWLLSVHPLEVVQANLTEDEALWAVLWTQGLSEEGGARMKTYHYGTKIAGGLYEAFTLVSGLKGAALAANAAVGIAQSAAAAAATEVLKKQLIDQASAAAASRVRRELAGSVQRLTQQQAIGAMQQAAVNRGSLTGVAWVAATVFDKADAWAYGGLEKLNANPLAGFTLHQKLLEQGLTANSLVLDSERMTALSKLADQRGRSDEVVAILGGLKPEELQHELTGMPLASAPLGFSYDAPAGQPDAQGLIQSMLSMPAESAAAK